MIILVLLTRFGKGFNAVWREWLPSPQQTRNEAPVMRKVKNNLQVNNPALMFAAGLESMIRDPLYSPSKFDNQEISELQRRTHKQDSRGNLFGALLRQFANF